jgi:predicted transglutaminase-like cysteine proteinase
VISKERIQNIKSERKKEINTYTDRKMKKLNRTSSEINRDILYKLEKRKEKIKTEDKWNMFTVQIGDRFLHHLVGCVVVFFQLDI